MPSNRVSEIFTERRAAGKGALLPFITAGYPSLDMTAALLPKLAAAGGSIIEIGFPFSDPIADGPVIAASMHEALAAGCTPEKVFATIERVRPQVSAALVAMVSMSIVDRMDPARFARAAAAAGFDGLIVPDLDLADVPTLRAACDAAGLACTLLVAPTSPPARVKLICDSCTGFVYALARAGITGMQAEAPDARAVIERIRAATKLPVAAGFGISTPEHVRAVCEYADGAIVGSAIVQRMRKAIEAKQDPAAAAVDLVKQMAQAIDAR